MTAGELGGAHVHARQSGLAHLVADDAAEALDLARAVLSCLPSSCWDPAPIGMPADAGPLPDPPASKRQVYDVRAIIKGIVDACSFLELQPEYARNLITGFARLEGRPVGVANQPRSLAGVLDLRAAEKGARFVRLCDAFGLPLITLVDIPGFLPGRDQEIGRCYPPRRQAPVRLRGGDCNAGNRNPAQGLWRSLHRDELALARCGRRLLLAGR